MPIYEFYCNRCNTIYSFYSKRVNTEKIPQCPQCENVELKRQMSVFSTISARGSGDDEMMDDMLPDMDEARMERAMEMLARESANIDEDDPRQAAGLMRKLAQSTGMELNAEMEEALIRLERGEDPERIEEEMGDILGDENIFVPGSPVRRFKGKKGPPRVDEKLYDLE